LKHWIVAWNTPDPLFVQGIHNRLLDHFPSACAQDLLNGTALKKPSSYAFLRIPPDEMHEMTDPADILDFWRVYLDTR
jgi:hypothetical protein